MQSSRIMTKDGSTVELTDSRISDTDISNWNGKQSALKAGDGITIGYTSATSGLTISSHSHSNKSVLDGITESDIDLWNNAADKSYSLTGGDSYKYGVFLCRTDYSVGVAQIFDVACLVLVRTLENSAAFVLNVTTHGTSRKYSLTQVDGTADMKFMLALVSSGTSGNAQYQYGLYLYTTRDDFNYWSVRIVPWRTTYVVWGPQLVDKATRESLKASAYNSVAVLGTDNLKIDGSNATSAGVSAAINKLTTGTAAPTDNDYYVAQYSGGGTTTTTYHRRPISALFSYIKSKFGTVGAEQVPVYFSDGVPVACNVAIPSALNTTPNVSSNALNGNGMLYQSGTGRVTTSQADVGMCWSNGSKYFTIVAGSGAIGGKAYFGAGDNSTHYGETNVVASAYCSFMGNVGTLILGVVLNPIGGTYTDAVYPVDSMASSSITVDKTFAVGDAIELMFKLNAASQLTGWSGYGMALHTGNANVFAVLSENRYITISAGAPFSSFGKSQVYIFNINLIR